MADLLERHEGKKAALERLSDDSAPERLSDDAAGLFQIWIEVRTAAVLSAQHAGVADLLERHEGEKAALERLFDDAAERDTPGEFSNAFACRLTLEPFREPVTTPSGLSYERSALLNHLKSVSIVWNPVNVMCRDPFSHTG